MLVAPAAVSALGFRDSGFAADSPKTSQTSVCDGASGRTPTATAVDVLVDASPLPLYGVTRTFAFVLWSGVW